MNRTGGAGGTLALNNPESKRASGLWLLYLAFKVLYLFKIKLGNCHVQMQGCTLEFIFTGFGALLIKDFIGNR